MREKTSGNLDASRVYLFGIMKGDIRCLPQQKTLSNFTCAEPCTSWLRGNEPFISSIQLTLLPQNSGGFLEMESS